jgi:hypothetical protein
MAFGTGAAGAVLGINQARLGKRAWLVPCLVIGSLLFLVEAWFFLFVFLDMVPSPEGSRALGLLMRLAIGVGFLLVQKPAFDAWKRDHWAPAREGERYRPGHTRQLFLVCFTAALVEVVMVVLMLFAAGKLEAQGSGHTEAYRYHPAGGSAAAGGGSARSRPPVRLAPPTPEEKPVARLVPPTPKPKPPAGGIEISRPRSFPRFRR